MVIQDWIVGLAMKDYVDRNFIQEFEKKNQLARKYLGLFRKTFQSYLDRGVLEVSLSQMKNAAATLSITMKGRLGRDFFVRGARQLEKVLENTTSSVTLYIEELHEVQLKYLHQLLKRLSRFGDRIHISLNEQVRDSVAIDSSVFNLLLDS